MMLKRLRPNNYIAVDGVSFAVPWRKVERGTSFFIPCVNAFEVVAQVRRCFKLEGWRYKYRIGPENGYFGVRFWRTL